MLAPDLSCSKCAALAPKCLPSFASSGDCGAVSAILAATDLGQVSSAVAANFVGCGDLVHVAFLVSCFLSDEGGLVSTRITGGRPGGRFGLGAARLRRSVIFPEDFAPNLEIFSI